MGSGAAALKQSPHLLLCYHARYYDPALARFVSADSISPEHTDPQTRNRCSYVLNNPLRYTDPSGHCAAGDSDDPAACQSAESVLNLYGIQLDSLANWMLKELSLVIGGVVDLRIAASWSIDQFKSAMGGGVSLVRGGSSKYAGYESNGTITLYDSAFSNGDDEAKRVVVHEFGHRWDEALQEGYRAIWFRQQEDHRGYVSMRLARAPPTLQVIPPACPGPVMIIIVRIHTKILLNR